ncbi:nitroreductase family deazaflavin-dependent oxidoreductase [Streptomyces eurythermus]|uniref:nitroreductase family deazaflavin-dependent oxidoreductase n=1 Tax=Streptomyces eurythermus TaxID=42237 RepID=UPI0036D3D354
MTYRRPRSAPAPTPRPVHPLIARIGATRAFTTLAPRLLHPCDLAVHRLSRGRWLPSRLLLPTVLLTTTGRRTACPRTVPVCAYPLADGSWLVAATNFGRRQHPAWALNLLHRPHATLTSHQRVQRVTAHRLPPGRVRAHRQHILTMLPTYDAYAARAGTREVHVFRLDPVAPPCAA